MPRPLRLPALLAALVLLNIPLLALHAAVSASPPAVAEPRQRLLEPQPTSPPQTVMIDRGSLSTRSAGLLAAIDGFPLHEEPLPPPATPTPTPTPSPTATPAPTTAPVVAPAPTIAPVPPAPSVAQAPPSPAPLASSGSLVWPTAGSVSQRFSAGHPALDLSAPIGTPVVAACAGQVVYAGWKDNGGGNVVDIACNNGLLVSNNHLSHVSVGAGPIAAGSLIGATGQTGTATGPHLHFGVQAANGWQDPLAFLS